MCSLRCSGIVAALVWANLGGAFSYLPARHRLGLELRPGSAPGTDAKVSDWRPLVRDLVHRVDRDVAAVLAGIDPALLDVAVEPGTNTIGWLLWHLTRSQDRNVNELRGQTQVWLSQRWCARFDRPADAGDTGYGHTLEDLSRFRSPRPETLLAYHRTVVASVDAYLDTVAEDDLHRLSRSPTLGNTLIVQQRLVGVLVEGLEHVGQAAILRGILERRAS